jgi:hypothetical protein
MGDVIGMPGIEPEAPKKSESTVDARRELGIALTEFIQLKGIEEAESFVGELLDVAWAQKEHAERRGSRSD